MGNRNKCGSSAPPDTNNAFVTARANDALDSSENDCVRFASSIEDATQGFVARARTPGRRGDETHLGGENKQRATACAITRLADWRCRGIEILYHHDGSRAIPTRDHSRTHLGVARRGSTGGFCQGRDVESCVETRVCRARGVPNFAHRHRRARRVCHVFFDFAFGVAAFTHAIWSLQAYVHQPKPNVCFPVCTSRLRGERALET